MAHQVSTPQERDAYETDTEHLLELQVRGLDTLAVIDKLPESSWERALTLRVTSLPYEHLALKYDHIGPLVDSLGICTIFSATAATNNAQARNDSILSLPAELQLMILSPLKLKELRNFASTSRATLNVVLSLFPIITTVRTQQPRLWAAIWKQDVAKNFPCAFLENLIHSDRCALCHSFGEFFFLLDMIRCCGLCYSMRHMRLRFVSASVAATCAAFTVSEVRKILPSIRTIRIPGKNRYELFSIEHVRNLAYSRRPVIEPVALIDELFNYDNQRLTVLNTPLPSIKAKKLRAKFDRAFPLNTANQTIVPIRSTVHGPSGGALNTLQLYRCTPCWIYIYRELTGQTQTPEDGMDDTEFMLTGTRPLRQLTKWPSRVYPEADFLEHLRICPRAASVWKYLLQFETIRLSKTVFPA